MKNFLQIKIYNKKGLFENILISKDLETGEQNVFHNFGYSLSPSAKSELENNGVSYSSIISITLLLKEAKKVLKEIFIDYNKIV